MKIIKTIKQIKNEVDMFRRENKVIGFVPTMGYFHEGHLSLIRIARENADIVIISIYVNPTQFGPHEDLDQYPRDYERDEQLAQKEGVDILFYPSDEEMYPSGYLTYVQVERITDILCGASRPHHFRGVATICSKLFHAVKPHFAVFGQKDYQQAMVIKQMVRDLNFDMDILIGPIIREEDGLAMSSRNSYLSHEERQSALSLYQSLRMAEEMVRQGEKSPEIIIKKIYEMIESKPHTKIDYIQIVHPESLQPLIEVQDRILVALAVFVGKTRLIDNMLIIQ